MGSKSNSAGEDVIFELSAPSANNGAVVEFGEKDATELGLSGVLLALLGVLLAPLILPVQRNNDEFYNTGNTFLATTKINLWSQQQQKYHWSCVAFLRRQASVQHEETYEMSYRYHWMLSAQVVEQHPNLQ